MKRLIIVLIILSSLSFQFIGCAEIKQKASYYWGKIKSEFSDKKTGSRENAVQRYKGSQEKLIVEQPVITPDIVSPGQKINQTLQYVLICPQKERMVTISETVSIATGKEKIEIAEKESVKAQGIYESIVEITIPQDLNPGEYKLITTISAGELRKTVSGNFKVRR